MEVQQALDHYRATAAQNAFAGCAPALAHLLLPHPLAAARSGLPLLFCRGAKMNKNPGANRTQLEFKVGNTHVLAAWFIAQHGLEVLSGWLTLAITIALAVQTGNYRVDESVLVGKNGGEPMVAARSDAYFALTMRAFQNGTSLSELVPCIETVLHGTPRDHCHTNGVDMGWGNFVVPSTYEMVHRHSLATLKALAANVNGKMRPNESNRPAPQGGRFMVLDWLSFPQSRDTISKMEAAGLAGRACLSRDQIVDACGYLATGWAAMLHSLGDTFDAMDCSLAEQLNTPTFVEMANGRLNIAGSGAVKLTSDQIVALAAAINPDGQGQGAAWLHSPMPINLFNAFFHRTCVEERFHGIVHLVVVNTDAQFSLDLTTESGVHWYLAAWYVNPAQDAD